MNKLNTSKFPVPRFPVRRHAVVAACACLLSVISLSACVAPGSSPSPQAAPAVSAAPVAAMKGPVLSAPTATSNTTRQSTPAGPVNSTSLMRDIAAEIGDAACDTDVQCRTLAVGSKACGGPEGYLPWSSKTSNGIRLSALAAAHAGESTRENERSGMRSNCSVTQDPGAVCRPRAQDGLKVCQTAVGRRSGAV